MVVANGLALHASVGHQHQLGAAVAFLHDSLSLVCLEEPQFRVGHDLHQVGSAHALEQGKLRQLVVYCHISEG